MDLKKYILYFIVVLIIFSHSIAHANTDEWRAITTQSSRAFNSYLDGIGISYIRAGSTMTIMINQQKALEAIPSLKEDGILNPELTQTFVNACPTLVSAYIGFLYTGVILIYTYKNMPLDKINVKIYIELPDIFGNNIQHSIASFKFSKNLFNKINWDNFDASMMNNLFPKVAPDFRYSEWYEEKMQEENENVGYNDNE